MYVDKPASTLLARTEKDHNMHLPSSGESKVEELGNIQLLPNGDFVNASYNIGRKCQLGVHDNI